MDGSLSAAYASMNRALEGATLSTLRLKREAELLRCCIRCPQRQALGACPGRGNCKDARRLRLNNVTDYDMEPISQVVPSIPITTEPLAAVVGGSEHGTSQAGSR